MTGTCDTQTIEITRCGGPGPFWARWTINRVEGEQKLSTDYRTSRQGGLWMRPNPTAKHTPDWQQIKGLLSWSLGAPTEDWDELQRRLEKKFNP